MLFVLRALALAALVLLIVAQRFAYTTVADLPTTPGNSAVNINYIGAGVPSEDVIATCPTGIEFTDPSRVAVIDVGNRRAVFIDTGARKVTSAADIELDPMLTPQGQIAGGNLFWIWAKDSTGDDQRVMAYAVSRGGAMVQVGRGQAAGVPGLTAPGDVMQRMSDLGYTGATPAEQFRAHPPIVTPTRLTGWQETRNVNDRAYALSFEPASSKDLTITVSEGAQTRTIHAKSRYEVEGARTLGIDAVGNVYVLVTFLDPALKTLSVHQAVYKANIAGGQVAIYDLPLEGQDCIARQHVAVSPTGEVYMLRVTAEHVALLKIGKRSFFSWFYMPFTWLGHTDPALLGPPFHGIGLMNAEASPVPVVNQDSAGSISRQDIINNACLYTHFKWTPASDNASPDLTATNPDMCNCSSHPGSSCQPWKPPVQVQANVAQVGLPYNWGGIDRLPEFCQKLSQKQPAGHVCTPGLGFGGHPIQDFAINDTYTAGVDCSGFVIRSLGLNGKKHYTTSSLKGLPPPDNMPKLVDVIDKQDLKPGDILLRAGRHVRLVVSWHKDGGQWFVDVMESISNEGTSHASSPSGVQKNSYAWPMQSYEPAHYLHVTGPNLTPAQTQCQPAADYETKCPL